MTAHEVEVGRQIVEGQGAKGGRPDLGLGREWRRGRDERLRGSDTRPFLTKYVVFIRQDRSTIGPVASLVNAVPPCGSRNELITPPAQFSPLRSERRRRQSS